MLMVRNQERRDYSSFVYEWHINDREYKLFAKSVVGLCRNRMTEWFGVCHILVEVEHNVPFQRD